MSRGPRVPVRAAVVLAPLLLSSAAVAQRDVSLETLARAMEGRLGVYAKNFATGAEVALNADKAFPRSPVTPALLPDSRPAGAGAPAETWTARGMADLVARLHRDHPRQIDHPARRALVTSAGRGFVAAGLSPVIEVGSLSTGVCRSPAAAGYAATASGDMVFAVLASDLESGFTAEAVFPEVVEACFRRLVPAFDEPPQDVRAPGLLLASLHEKGQDPRLFPRTPEGSVADLRRGSQRLGFKPGEVARIAVLARPERAARVTVQWWSPAQRADACETIVIDPGRLGDAVFDRPLEKLGAWRVRVAFGNAIVLDEKFFVTAR